MSHDLDQGAQMIALSVAGAALCVVAGAAYCPSEAYCPSSWAVTAKELTASIDAMRASIVADKMMRFKEPPSFASYTSPTRIFTIRTYILAYLLTSDFVLHPPEGGLPPTKSMTFLTTSHFKKRPLPDGYEDAACSGGPQAPSSVLRGVSL